MALRVSYATCERICASVTGLSSPPDSAGAWLVTLTKRVPDPPDGAPVLRLVLKTELRMSWASASVYIQQRV